jgi:hypothetical protein
MVPFTLVPSGIFALQLVVLSASVVNVEETHRRVPAVYSLIDAASVKAIALQSPGIDEAP